MLKFNLAKKTMPKIGINIGSLFDIPTGTFIIGAKGETILNGGLSSLTSLTGTGNSFKSTIIHYMMLSAANKIKYSTETAMTTYDTEVNISLDRLTNLATRFENFDDGVIMGENPIWSITDKSLATADEWVNELNKYADAKAKDKNSMITYTAFKDPYSNQPLKTLVPTFVEIDSLSEFEASSTVDLMDKDLDDSKTNTAFMKQGLFKTKFISTLPRLSNSANINILTTAHIGEKIDMSSGPAMYNQPTKKLQYLKQGDSIKGVSNKFFFLINNGWYAHTARVLKNQTTRLPEYPKSKTDNSETELNAVRLTALRSKSGASGYTLELVISQNEGVLPSLTEFHYIKTNGRYGIDGSMTNYHLDLLPDLNLSRTTIRRKIDENEKLRRALNITSEMLQIATFHPQYINNGLLCTPKELYDDLKAMGYDWDILLNSRGFWVPDQYAKDVKPFLSTVDLLKMRKGDYIPYWYDKSKLKLEKK